MTKKTSPKKIYKLFDGTETTNRSVALKARRDFINSFLVRWEESDADDRFKLIRHTAELPPEEGISLVLSGMQDFTRDVKLETKRALTVLTQKIIVNENRTMSQRTAVRSEVFSRRIYIEMADTQSLDEIKMYLEILLEIGGRGPFFAWKFFTDNTIPPNIFLDILNKLPEALRLRFAQYFFTTELSEKRKHAVFMRELLKGIHDDQEAARFLVNIIDNASDCPHSAINLNGTILTDFMDQVNTPDRFLNLDLSGLSDADKLMCVKIAGISDKTGILYRFLPFLDPAESRKVRLNCVRALGNSHSSDDVRIKNALLALLDDDDPYIIPHVFEALIRLEIPDIVSVTLRLIKQQSRLRVKLYKSLCVMDSGQMIAILDHLEEPLATDARRTVGKLLIKRNPERIEVLLEHHKNNQNSNVKTEAEKLYNVIRSMRDSERKEILEQFIPDSFLKSLRIRQLIQNQSAAKQLKKITDLTGRDPEESVRLCNEFFTDIDLAGFRIDTVDFSGSVFLNADLSSINLRNVCLKNGRFEKTSFNNAVFENVVFDNCVLIDIEAHSARFESCSFTSATICNSSFEFAEMTGVYFTGALIISCNFSRADLSFASFTGARLYLSDFKHTSFNQAEIAVTKGMLCDFSETNIYETATFSHSDLHSRLKDWNRIEIPPVFYQKELLETKWLNVLILTNEMDSQREAFFKYNKRRKACTIDAFKPDLEDLFEIIPLLIHLTQILVPFEIKKEDTHLHENFSLKNRAAGIYGYVPSQKAVQLAKKHLNCDKLLLLPGKQSHIEALFTIGSLGTVAQSSTSDIDYWVCINKSRMDSDAVSLLKLKLEAIETWAKTRFATELHFFVVDPESIRGGQYGGSDFESSGSAQGMILKEEFYRTMILIAGKIPFWCVLPAWTADKYYNLLYLTANRFHTDYLDFGNVSKIPPGEYFGASMWQLFKSLTSPYKSVMKMALLEKYIKEGEKSRLLCNLLKKKWSTGKCNFRYQDPYLLLFEQISDFYRESDQKDIQALVRICFFLKLGIRSMTDLDKSVLKIRKVIVQKCIENFAWEESMLCELGYFNEWPFDKILNLSALINNFMIESYRKLSGLLKQSIDSEAVITDRDLTMLGRKMFVQFVPQPHKVPKLPHVTEGRRLFKQLYVYYRKNARKKPSWEVYSEYNKNDIVSGNTKAILKDIEHIEEVAAWVIQNNLLNCGTTFNILPNPTFVSAQDFNDLITDMTLFFDDNEENSVPPSAFLEQYKPIKLYTIINFSGNRKADRVFDYVAVYLTSWGELYCRAYKSKKGLESLSDTLEQIIQHLELSFENTQMGYHIPKMSRKRIKKQTDG